MEQNSVEQSTNTVKSMMPKRRFDRFEASEYLGVSVVTIDRALAQRKISCFRIGRRVLFDVRHLEEFLEMNECKAKPVIRRGQI